MRKPPSLRSLPAYPATGGTAILAAALTALSLADVNLSFLMMDVRAWHGEPWRLLTSALPHGDLIHLAFNLYWLWVFGTVIEDFFGHVRTLGLFCLLAASSGAAEYAVFGGGIGLSGVGYGLFGFIWLVGRRDVRFRDCLDRSTIQLFVAWFFLCILLTALDIWRIANVAHAVGWGIGALVGLAYSARSRLRRVLVGSVPACMLAIVLAATAGRPYVNLSGNGDAAAFYLAGRAMDAGEYEHAVEYLDRAVELNDRRPESWYNLGLAYHRLDMAREAVRALERAEELDPEDSDTKELLATSRAVLACDLGEEGRSAEAAELLRDALEVLPREPVLWYGLGGILQEMGCLDEAKESYERAAKLDPEDEDVRRALEELGDFNGGASARDGGGE
jgi:GlpG protein